MLYNIFMNKNSLNNLIIGAVLLLFIFSFSQTAWAETAVSESEEIPNQYGLGLTGGSTYDPVSDINFLQINAFALFDYDKIWPHAAPEPLRFKVECNLGATTSSPHRAIASGNILALYYLDYFSTHSLRPYMEAGIGVIYTDFQVKGQGLRVNFNPQFGIGTEVYINSKPAFYIALRAHHLSNAEIDEDNRGVNSVTLTAGRFF